MENKRTRVCLLGASPSAGNLGLVALASAISSIRDCLPGAEVVLVDYAHKPMVHAVGLPGAEARVELVNLRYSKRLLLPNNIVILLVLAGVSRVLPLRQMRQMLLSRNPWLYKVSQADFALSLAGGDSFSDIYGMSRLIYVVLPQLLFILLKKPLVQLPQTYGPYRRWAAQWVSRFILHRSTLIFSRDRQGLEIVHRLLGVGHGEVRARFAYDMGFALAPSAPSEIVLGRIGKIKREGPVVGLNVSGLLYMGGYTRDNMFGLRCVYPELMRRIIELFVRREEAQVLLVPHVMSRKPSQEADGDVSLALYRELAAQCKGRLHLLDGEFTAAETKYIIGQCDFFLGSRMHACIAAVSQAVPAVSLAYSAKFIGVMESIGVGGQVVDLRTLETGQVMKVVSEVYRGRKGIRDSLLATMPDVQRSVRNIISEIWDLLQPSKAAHQGTPGRRSL